MLRVQLDSKALKVMLVLKVQTAHKVQLDSKVRRVLSDHRVQ